MKNKKELKLVLYEVKKHCFMLILFLQACSNIKNSQDESEKTSMELTSESFRIRDNCIDLSVEFLDTWKREGGEIEKSILTMREHIEQDDISEFSHLVKSIWKEQEKLGFYEDKKDIGTWPVSKNKYNKVVDTISIFDKSTNKSCGVLYVWSEYMGNEFETDANGNFIPNMIELPKSLKLEYLEHKTWLKYWIFVNIK